MASSQTSSNQTNSRLQAPEDCVSGGVGDGTVLVGYVGEVMGMRFVGGNITYCEMVSIILETKLILQQNVPLAVDTLSLVLADDHVAESSAILKDEDSVLLATLNLVVACAVTTVVLRSRQR